LCGEFSPFCGNYYFPKKNILLQILSFKNEIAEKRKSPEIARTAYNMKGRSNFFDFHILSVAKFG
jgi:hypothetical protein